MIGRKKKAQPYDRQHEIPVIRASICTGEQVAGFRNIQTKEYTEIMVISNQADLDTFCEKYCVDKIDIKKEY